MHLAIQWVMDCGERSPVVSSGDFAAVLRMQGVLISDGTIRLIVPCEPIEGFEPSMVGEITVPLQGVAISKMYLQCVSNGNESFLDDVNRISGQAQSRG